MEISSIPTQLIQTPYPTNLEGTLLLFWKKMRMMTLRIKTIVRNLWIRWILKHCILVASWGNQSSHLWVCFLARQWWQHCHWHWTEKCQCHYWHTGHCYWTLEHETNANLQPLLFYHFIAGEHGDIQIIIEHTT